MKNLKNLLLFTILLSVSNSFASTYTYQELYDKLEYSKIEKTLRSSPEMDSLAMYIDPSDTNYSEINQYLRHIPHDWYAIGPKEAKATVKDIDYLMKNHPALSQDLVLFRGLNLNWRSNRPFKINEEFTDKAYISTSLNLKIAEQFATKENENGVLLVMYFENKPSKGILVPSNEAQEEEVLLERGMSFKVMDTKKRDSYTLHLVQICGHSECKRSIKNEDAKKIWAQF
jgi:hypothetical protein